jgi:hypothetical protein
MYLCTDESCATGFGFWSFIPCIYFDGAFMAYTGGYWSALWAWLKGEFDD